MIRVPAFVLGNSTTLPVDVLGLLSGRFTIGTNRILRTGFAPTVLAWTDRNLFEDPLDAELIDKCDAIKICAESAARGEREFRLRHVRSDVYLHHPLRWQCSGSSGAAAAIWAFSIGAPHVYLLGMSCTKEPGGPSNFWGDQPKYRGGTYATFQREKDKLFVWFPHRVTDIGDANQLRDIIDMTQPVDHNDIRDAVIAELQSRNAPGGKDFQ